MLEDATMKNQIKGIVNLNREKSVKLSDPLDTRDQRFYSALY